MNWDRIDGKWKQLTGALKSRWRKLTDDDLNVIAGKKNQLIGRIQERYGVAKDEAQKQVEDWNESLDRKSSDNLTDAALTRKAS
ncbi:MAG: CsbD family protein [Terriglobales bacterium]